VFEVELIVIDAQDVLLIALPWLAKPLCFWLLFVIHNTAALQ
jgi:hypothetical protein